MITVSVTEKHIAAGKPGLPEGCPIALALEDCGLFRVSVGYQTIWANPSAGSRRLGYKFPRKARLFAAYFDAHRPVEPFTFNTKPLADGVVQNDVEC
jgi:hypothetical protein